MVRNKTLIMATAQVCAGLGDRENIGEVIANVYKVFKSLGEDSGAAQRVAESVGDDYIVCLEDGKKLKMLKRYLKAKYKMSEEQYRAKWGLPPDYPMVAPKYAKVRSELAKKSGLGRKS